jgi:hypothetical protein
MIRSILTLLLTIFCAVPSWAVNDFSGDSDVKGVYNFENGAAIDDDSQGTASHLTNSSATDDTTNFKQGSQSAAFNGSTQYMSATDASLETGFPLKNGDTTKNISVAAWVRIASLPGSGSKASVFAKYDYSLEKRGFIVQANNISGTTFASIVLGYGNGLSAETINHASSLSATTWYHITATYQNSDKAYAIRVRDASCATVGSDLTGTATLDANKLFVSDVAVSVGASNGGSVFFLNGSIDELVVTADVLTETESTRICNGTFPSGGGGASLRSLLLMGVGQ